MEIVTDAVDLALLEQRDSLATSSFVAQLHGHGIGVIRVSPELAALHARCVEAAKLYFSSAPAAQKLASKMGQDGNRDWGYVHMAGVKEFYQMRHNTGEENPWPLLSAEYFEASSRIARICLAALARGLRTAEEHLVDKMMDADDAKSVSSSIFRFFHYFGETQQQGCLSHTDIGLITLIPATNCAALEIMDQCNYSWRPFESTLGPNDMMVLVGETLERLTAYHYPAVVRERERGGFVCLYFFFVFRRFIVFVPFLATAILWCFCCAPVPTRC
jgi:hypothetical protein